MSEAQIKQDPRLLKIDSPLGTDALILRKLRVTEAIFAPFRIEGEVLSANDGLKSSDLVDKLVTCTIQRETADSRHFHGYVRSFGRTGALGRGYTIYQFEAVPTLWNLTRTSDCRIFQKESVQDIVTKLLTEADITDYSWNCSVATKPRDYTVQYNETDWDFLHRLLAEVGIGYCFRHSAGKHELVFCNAAADWPQVPGNSLVVQPTEVREDTLSSWQPKGSIQIGKVVSVDTDLLKFKGRDEKTQTTTQKQSYKDKWEIYLAPGGQAAQTDVDPARALLEAAEAEAETVTATGRDRDLFAGGKVKIAPSMEAGQETFLITEILHEAYDETQLNSQATDEYRNSFTVVKGNVPWRPRQTRGRPVMPGLQRAMVTGKAGEEIHVDDHGRIKVQFLWDRYGKKDENSSCWVRVMQPLAGAWGGTWFLPRLGDEVLVAFIDGDADRPVVVGSLYNAEAPPAAHNLATETPASGKKNKPLTDLNTRTGIKTRSSKGGGASNFNMIMLDDEAGKELFDVQAEKDLTILVKNDRTEHVKNDRKETIDGKHTEVVKLDFSTKVTEGNQELIVNEGNIDTTADKGNISTVAKMGNIDTKASMGAITIEAKQSITLKVGASKITMDMSGITLEAVTITSKGTAMVATEAPMIKETAQALVVIQAALIKLN